MRRDSLFTIRHLAFLPVRTVANIQEFGADCSGKRLQDR
jgi:hypothetical protein